MPLSIKVNLRVTGHCNQGGRKYMEDMFSVAYQQTSDDRDLEYAFFGIFDGHGGGEAAKFAKENLMDIIVKQKNFWSDEDEDVLRAIRDGYVNTHYAMWRELDKWPRTASGLPSTAGTTASIAFIRRGKIYIGHVGDSGIVLGYQDDEGDPQWKAKPLTKDHKPESGPEMTRIQESGGKVISKSGVPRVVWNRPRIGHKGPVRRSTHIDEIPFLAVARSLGDLWSYNSELDTFVVSPEPDVKVIKVDVKSHRCLIFGTDGLWNMLTPQAAVSIVQAAEKHNEKHFIASQQTGNILHGENQMWINPSKSLVDRALERWSSTRLRADNTSVVTLMIDPPGPSRPEFLLNRSRESNMPINSPQKCAPMCRSLSGMYNHPDFHDKNSPISNIHNQAQVSPCSAKLLENNYSNNQQLQRSVSSSSSAFNDKLTDNYSNDNSNLSLSGNANKIAFTYKKQPKNNPVFDTVGNNSNNCDSKLNSSDLENIQVAEVSSSDITLYNDTNNSVPSITDDVDELLATDIDDINGENILQNNEPEINELSKELPDISKSFHDYTDEGHELVRQNAFSHSLDNFDNIKSKTQITTPLTIITAATTITTTTTTSTTASSTSHIINDDINNITYDENLTNITSLNCKKECEQQKNDNVIPNKSNEITLVTLKEPPRVIKRREISLRSDINPRVTTKAIVHKTIASTTIKRRHSSTFDITSNDVICNVVVHQQEPPFKRRTRSEDHKCLTRNENTPNNQKQFKQQQLHSRLRWLNSSSVKNRNINAAASYLTGGVENNILSQTTAMTMLTPTTSSSSSSFQRRNLEKKATLMKNVRRSSINYSISSNNGTSGVGCSARLAQIRNNFTLKDWDQTKSNRKTVTPGYSKEDHRLKLNCIVVSSGNSTSNSAPTSSPPQRWLRSDTIAATPIKTLRSRNVDIAGHTIPPQLAHQYGIVKQNRHSLNPKLNKLSSTSTKIISKSSMPLTGNKLIKSSNGINHGNNSSGLTISNTVSVITKRVKSSSYNSSARSRLGTRSRLKRLSK